MTDNAKPTASSTTTSVAPTQSYAYGNSSPAPQPAVPTVVSAKQIGDDFEANQVAAEKKWGGKYVQFTSVVSNINSSGVSFHNVTTKFSFTQISCRVADENALLNLIKGKQATVRGVLADDQLLGVITINDCEIIGG